MIKYKYQNKKSVKKALTVVNIKNGKRTSYVRYTLPSIMKYAEKYNYDLFEIQEKKYQHIINTPSPKIFVDAYEKYQSFEYISDYDFILNIDIDIIILENADDIYNYHKTGYFSACPNYADLNESHIYKEITSKGGVYINSGVFCFDRNTLQDRNDLVFEHNKFKNLLKYPDQDFLNHYFRDKKNILPREFNLNPKFLNAKDNCFVHFAGSKKNQRIKDFIIHSKYQV